MLACSTGPNQESHQRQIVSPQQNSEPHLEKSNWEERRNYLFFDKFLSAVVVECLCLFYDREQWKGKKSVYFHALLMKRRVKWNNWVTRPWQ